MAPARDGSGRQRKLPGGGPFSPEKEDRLGSLDSAVERLPSAQDMTPGSRDRVPHQGPRREPASPSAWVSSSLSGSLMNK